MTSKTIGAYKLGKDGKLVKGNRRKIDASAAIRQRKSKKIRVVKGAG